MESRSLESNKKRTSFFSQRKKFLTLQYKMSNKADLNQKLCAGYQPKQRATVKGKRTHYVNSVIKLEASPNDEYRVTIPKLSERDVIYMDTIS